jgi:hypothetical protein
LAILGGSFRLLVRASLPLVLLFILSACGGSTPAKEPTSSRVVRGPGFTFAAPSAWTARRTPDGAVAKRGDSQVSATVFALLKPYDPSRFGAAAKELDGVAERLAGQAGGAITERVTTVVDGRKIRAYRYESNGARMRIGFLLEGKREYQLLCTSPGAADVDGACSLLFSSFSAA